jgi:hypothetical protein
MKNPMKNSAKIFCSNTYLCVLFVVLLASCQQAIDLDTNRTVTATNLPEITDVSPKIVWFGDNITITGKNFVNVERLQLGSITLDSVRVLSPTQVTARIPNFNSTLYYQQLFNRRLLAPLSLSAKLGTAQYKFNIAWASNRVQGFVTAEGRQLDSVLTSLTHVALGRVVFPSFGETSQGFFTGDVTIFSPALQTGTEIIVRPFLSGYRFTPTEARVRTTAVGGTDLIVLGSPEFTATRVPTEQLPQVQVLLPTTASIQAPRTSSRFLDTTISITVRGVRLSGVKQALLQEESVFNGVNFVPSQTRRPLTLRIENDAEISVQVRETATAFARPIKHSRLYLIGDNGSILASQRFTIIHN